MQAWGSPDDVVPPGRYRHVKGGLYEVLGLAFVADGADEGGTAVVYRPLYEVPGPPVAVRSLAGWLTPAADGRPRFTRLDDGAATL